MKTAFLFPGQGSQSVGMGRDFYDNFKYQTIMTEDVVAYFNQQTGMNLTPVFDQYLRHASLPVLDLQWGPGGIRYRWEAAEPGFAMPVMVGSKEHWERIHPTTAWQTMPTALAKDDFEVATDLFYITVSKQ